MKSQQVWGVGLGVVMGVAATALFWSSDFFPIAVGSAFCLGYGTGRWYARHRIIAKIVSDTMSAIKPFEEAGAVSRRDAVTDFLGRELLTIWVPLAHEITDDDRSFVYRLSAMFEQEEFPVYVKPVSVEFRSDAVGVKVRGRDANTVLEAIRPFFQRHCPKGTYVSRHRLPLEDQIPDFAGYPGWPRLLFDVEGESAK